MENIKPIKQYNENKQVIYSKDENGLECWMEYDERGLLIHYKDSDGNEKFWNNKNNKHRLLKKKKIRVK